MLMFNDKVQPCLVQVLALLDKLIVNIINQFKS